MADDLQGLGRWLFERAAGREITDELRGEIEQASAASPPDSPASQAEWSFLYPSLVRDPRDSQTLYLAADQGGDRTRHKLLVFSRAADGSVGCEARPFSPSDREQIHEFAKKIDPRLLPRPQKDRPSVAVGNRHPEISLPAAFAAFGRILDETGANLASTVQLSATREMSTDEVIAARSGDDPTEIGHTRVSIEHLYHCGLWAALRAGWRHGYTAEADHFIISGATADEIAASTEATRKRFAGRPGTRSSRPIPPGCFGCRPTRGIRKRGMTARSRRRSRRR